MYASMACCGLVLSLFFSGKILTAITIMTRWRNTQLFEIYFIRGTPRKFNFITI